MTYLLRPALRLRAGLRLQPVSHRVNARLDRQCGVVCGRVESAVASDSIGSDITSSNPIRQGLLGLYWQNYFIPPTV